MVPATGGEAAGAEAGVVHLQGRLVPDRDAPDQLAGMTLTVIDPRTDRILSHLAVAADGSLRGVLPPDTRGRELLVSLERTAAGSTGPAGAVSRMPLTVPATGDATVRIPVTVDVDHALGSSDRILAPDLLAARIAAKARYTEEIAAARRRAFADVAAPAESEPPVPASFTDLVEPMFPARLTLPAGAALIDFILDHPVAALATTGRARSARLRLTEDEQARLGTHPTLAEALGARAHRYGLRRKPRLSERLATTARIDALTLPADTPHSAPPGPAPAPPPDVDQLAADAERAVLTRTASVLADAAPSPDAPTTASDLTRLHELAGQLELAAGAANVTAAKDVHVLQLAYRTPLRRIWSRRLLAALGELDRRRIQIERTTGVTLPLSDRRVTTPAQLRALLDESQRLVQRVMTLEDPPDAVSRAFPAIDAAAWGRLSDDTRLDLSNRAVAAGRSQPMQTLGLFGGIVGGIVGFVVGGPPGAAAGAAIGSGLEDVVEPDGDDGVPAPPPVVSVTPRPHPAPWAPLAPSVLAQTEATLTELKKRLTGRFEFDVHEPGSVNYGLMLTYRQEWSPVRYQVGRLIDTIPLTPGEKREVKVVTARRTHDARSSLTSQTRESVTESTSISRLESEAIEAATMAVNNQFSANGSFTIGVASVGGSSEIKLNTGEELRRTLKNFSELSRKAVDTIKNQVEVKVESSEDLSSELTDLRTITNTNNELTVTFLLYELERRYRVETQLAAVTPVILYARDVPDPDEITAAWILEHSDPIRHFLLDPTLRPVLDDLERTHSSAELDHRMARAQLAEQRQIYTTLAAEIDELETAVAAVTSRAAAAAIGAATAEAAEPSVVQTIATAVVTGGISLLLPSGSTEDESLDARARADEKLVQELTRTLDVKRAAIASAAGAIATAHEAYRVTALARHRAQLAEARLAVHLRDNIFHYLHGIWSTEHPDNRYFALHDAKVPFHRPRRADYVLTDPPAPGIVGHLPGIDTDGEDKLLSIRKPGARTTVTRTLAEVADIDRPLGFRGNFVVFELRESSQLTDHLTADFVDPDTGVAVPGAITGLSTGELVDYLEDAIALGLVDDRRLEALKGLARQIAHEQSDWSDDLVLPTGQVMLDALKGETTLLEPFKLVHRGLDVLSAEEEVRIKRLDALRRARRIATADLTRDPTTVERFYLSEDADAAPDDAPA